VADREEKSVQEQGDGEPGPSRSGRVFISDGETLTPLEAVPWNNRQLTALLSLALEDERLVHEGVFAVLRSKTGSGYTARRIAAIPSATPELLRVTLCAGRWIAVGPAGTEPREVFPDGKTRPWEGPVPVEALS
jgi:hypothetical protein